ncbi:MAG: phage minor capsid protein, partial [Lactobacillus sp.]|nr:phage minor capsid protein [Lactobacillus sp.]
MITDIEIDELIQPIINLYNQMELELIVEIARRFKNYDAVAGSLEWQLKKLQELGGLNIDVLEIISKYSGKSQTEIKKLIQKAGLFNLDMDVLDTAFDKGVINVDPAVLLQSPAIAATIEHSYKEINKTYKLIQTKAVESSRQAYMNIINT